MATFDIVVLVVAVISFIYGMKRGIIIELSGVVGIILAIWAGTHFSYIVYDFMVAHFDVPSTAAPLIAFGLTVVIALMLFSYIARLLNKMINATILSIVNRLLGGIFSTLKILFLISCGIYVYEQYCGIQSDRWEAAKQSSISYTPIKSLAGYIIEKVDIPASKQAIQEFITDKVVK